MRTYSELRKLKTYEERLKYLQLEGTVGENSLDLNRYYKQKFYRSKDWIRIREEVIVRDLGCDLGIVGENINGIINVHHMNPISLDDMVYGSDILLNPEYLITTSDSTHKAIHYGRDVVRGDCFVERSKNDTSPWR